MRLAGAEEILIPEEDLGLIDCRLITKSKAPGKSQVSL
jgi:hypothetical protein